MICNFRLILKKEILLMMLSMAFVSTNVTFSPVSTADVSTVVPASRVRIVAGNAAVPNGKPVQYNTKENSHWRIKNALKFGFTLVCDPAVRNNYFPRKLCTSNSNGKIE